MNIPVVEMLYVALADELVELTEADGDRLLDVDPALPDRHVVRVGRDAGLLDQLVVDELLDQGDLVGVGVDKADARLESL